MNCETPPPTTRLSSVDPIQKVQTVINALIEKSQKALDTTSGLEADPKSILKEQLHALTLAKATFTREITPHPLLQAHHLDNNYFLDAILNALINGVSILDTDLTILKTNLNAGHPHARRIPFEGCKCYEKYQGQSSPCDDCPSLRALKSGRPEKKEMCFTQKNNAKGYLEIYAFPIKNDLGQTIGVIEYVRDITDQKKIELTLAERNIALERSNQDLDDFAYIASHDLKEPLRGIANYAGFLMEDYGETFDPECLSKLKTMIRLCEREVELINALLAYPRVGRSELSIMPVALDPLVRQVIERITPSCNINTTWIRILSPLPEVQCDRSRIGEVFLNLILKGIKYNDATIKEVEIGFYKKGDPAIPPEISDWFAIHQAEFLFFVRDNGIGIRAKDFDKIFTLFKRLHGRDRYCGGTGVGLTIVKKVIERHNGAIRVASEPKKGSTFYFTLGAH